MEGSHINLSPQLKATEVVRPRQIALRPDLGIFDKHHDAQPPVFVALGPIFGLLRSEYSWGGEIYRVQEAQLRDHLENIRSHSLSHEFAIYCQWLGLSTSGTVQS